jgi:hypothetical protein
MEIVVVAFVVTLGWILMTRIAERRMRDQLGGVVQEIPLFRKWMTILQYILIGFALLLPVVVVYLKWKAGRPWSDAVVEFGRSLWLLTMVYAMRKGSTMLFGERGFTLGSLGIVEWKDLKEVRWDSDIGQQQWGVRIVIQKGRQIIRPKLYFHREFKPRVEELLRIPL